MTPSYAVDQLVCASPDLLQLDERMRLEMGRANEVGTMETSPLVESQNAWNRRRGLCAFRHDVESCVRAAYQERILTLVALAGGATPGKAALVRCSPGIGSGVTLVATPFGGILFGSDAVVAVAVAGEEEVWRPFLRYSLRGSVLRLTRMDGASWKCQLGTSQ